MRDARGTATESVVPVRQCDPELAASRSIPGSLSYPPASHPPPSPPPPASHLPLSLPLHSRLLVSSSPLLIRESKGGTIKPQDAFREDPVTRALALSSALTKSATEREETRPLRESLLVAVWRWYYPRIDTLISCHPVSVLVPDGLLNIFLPLSRAHLRWFSPQFHGNEIHVLRLCFFPCRNFFSIPQLRGALFLSFPLFARISSVFGKYVNTAVFVSLI